MGMLSRPILLSLMVFAMGSDMTKKMISNRLILFGYLFCLLKALESFRFSAILQVLQDLSFPVFLFYLLFLIGVIGAGDVKLLSMISGFTGYVLAVKVALLALIIGAVWSLALLIYHRAFMRNMTAALQYGFDLLEGNLHAYPARDYGRIEIVFPFSVCIGIALFVLLMIQS